MIQTLLGNGDGDGEGIDADADAGKGKGGLAFVGTDEKGERIEVIELRGHPWFVGVQFHPEYLSRVLAPSRTYLGFVAAAAGCLKEVTREFSEKKV